MCKFSFGNQSNSEDWTKVICLCLCWGLTSQSTIFQSCRDGATASWVINQYFRGVKCLAQGHNTAAVGFQPPTSRSGVRHSTTEPPRSPKVICLVEDYSRNISENFCQNIFSEIAIKAYFHFSHFIAIATRVLIRLEQKLNCLFHQPIDAVYELWKESASWLQRRRRLKMLTTDDGRTTDACLYYKLTYEPSAQVS